MSVFRREYRQLSPEESATVGAIKTLAENLYNLIHDSHRDPRAASLAKTKLEESVMWAVKGITG